ncbi:hypothetical protein TWF730_000636 [Orbilia blumenaviensis]|uniref:Uncharacterized protein n=1 Tax=Orbilia blumenaviensis TaxID=1796055 RepID=A0AAV9VMH2_9PEZI
MGFKDVFEFVSAAAKRASEDRETVARFQGYLKYKDLTYEDQQVIRESRYKSRQYFQTGATTGLLLGVGAALLIIRRRGAAFRNFRSMQGSGATIRFADGREELITNFVPAGRPSFARNTITLGALGTAGYMFGAMMGQNYGESILNRYLAEHPDSVQRIRAWERKVVIEALKTAVDYAEKEDAERSEREGISPEPRGFDSWPPPDNPPPEFPRSF